MACQNTGWLLVPADGSNRYCLLVVKLVVLGVLQWRVRSCDPCGMYTDITSTSHVMDFPCHWKGQNLKNGATGGLLTNWLRSIVYDTINLLHIDRNTLPHLRLCHGNERMGRQTDRITDDRLAPPFVVRKHCSNISTTCQNANKRCPYPKCYIA